MVEIDRLMARSTARMQCTRKAQGAAAWNFRSCTAWHGAYRRLSLCSFASEPQMGRKRCLCQRAGLPRAARRAGRPGRRPVLGILGKISSDIQVTRANRYASLWLLMIAATRAYGYSLESIRVKQTALPTRFTRS